MRIISGTWKGRTLPAKIPPCTRPTLDAARESIFNILVNLIVLDNCNVADLFAGSGAMGLEALSRGAGHVVFVDNEKAAIRCMTENVQSLGVDVDHYACIQSEALSFLSSTSSRFDLIFIDPPYADHALNACVNAIENRQVLNAEGIIVAEHGLSEHVLLSPAFTLLRTRAFGETIVDFIAYTAR